MTLFIHTQSLFDDYALFEERIGPIMTEYPEMYRYLSKNLNKKFIVFSYALGDFRDNKEKQT